MIKIEFGVLFKLNARWIPRALGLLGINFICYPVWGVDLGDIPALYHDEPTSKGLEFVVPSSSDRSLLELFNDVQIKKQLAEELTTSKVGAMGDARLGTRLKHLAAAARRQTGERLHASAKGLDFSLNQRQQVEMEVTLTNAEEMIALNRLAQRFGGQAHFLDRLDAGLASVARHKTALVIVPLYELEPFLEQASSRYFELTWPMQPSYGGAVGEGGAMMQLQNLHATNITGQGATVAIIDMEFQHAQALVEAGELPSPQASIAFDQLGQAVPFPMPREGSSGVHGSACAEIVADVAPQAKQIWLQFAGNAESLYAALRWLAEQDVDIVNASWGSHHARIDGLSLADRLVDAFVQSTHVLWINAAGNHALNTWTGSTADEDNDGWIDNAVILQFDPRVPKKHWSKAWSAVVQWDDWKSTPEPLSDQDIDAYVLIKQGDKLVVWAKSEESQRGQTFPREVLVSPEGRALPEGKAMLAFRAKQTDRVMRLRVSTPEFLRIFPHQPAYSISSPASAKHALAVGAINVVDDDYAGQTGVIANYSSRGPSWDERLKPEVSAPTAVISQAFLLATGSDPAKQQRFNGTSAAAPHAAGFAALLKSVDATLNRDALWTTLLKSAQALGNPQPNTVYGHGLLVAQPSAPKEKPDLSTQERVEKVVDQLLSQ